MDCTFQCLYYQAWSKQCFYTSFFAELLLLQFLNIVFAETYVVLFVGSYFLCPFLFNHFLIHNFMVTKRNVPTSAVPDGLAARRSPKLVAFSQPLISGVVRDIPPGIPFPSHSHSPSQFHWQLISQGSIPNCSQLSVFMETATGLWCGCGMDGKTVCQAATVGDLYQLVIL